MVLEDSSEHVVLYEVACIIMAFRMWEHFASYQCLHILVPRYLSWYSKHLAFQFEFIHLPDVTASSVSEHSCMPELCVRQNWQIARSLIAIPLLIRDSNSPSLAFRDFTSKSYVKPLTS